MTAVTPTMVEAPLAGRDRLDLGRVLGYGGAGVAIVAIYALLANLPRHGGWATLGVSVAYALPLLAGAWLLRRRGYPRAAGLLATIAVTLAAWVVYAVERIADWWPSSDDFLGTEVPTSHTRWSLVALLAAPGAAALLAFLVFRFTFLFAVAAPSVGATVLELVPKVLGHRLSDDGSAWAAIAIGAGLIVVGLLLDAAHRRRDAFWWHLAGLSYVLFGFVWLATTHGWIRWVGLGVAVAAALAAAVIRRLTWAAYAGVGLFIATLWHTGHAAERHHWLLPLLFSLAALGAILAALGPRRVVVVEAPPEQPIAAPEVPSPPAAESAVEDLPPPEPPAS
jgi:MFS family permease